MPIGIGRPSKTRRSTFGQRLASAREEAGLTQTQLAKKINASQRVITYWERGHVALRPDQLSQLSDALGVSADYFLGRDSKKRGNGPSGKMRLLFEAASQLPRSQQEKVLAVLEPFVNQHAKAA